MNINDNTSETTSDAIGSGSIATARGRAAVAVATALNHGWSQFGDCGPSFKAIAAAMATYEIEHGGDMGRRPSFGGESSTGRFKWRVGEHATTVEVCRPSGTCLTVTIGHDGAWIRTELGKALLVRHVVAVKKIVEALYPVWRAQLWYEGIVGRERAQRIGQLSNLIFDAEEALYGGADGNAPRDELLDTVNQLVNKLAELENQAI